MSKCLTVSMNDLLYEKMWGHGGQWNFAQMNNLHPKQMKLSKSRGPFLSYQLNCTANPALTVKDVVGEG